MMPHAALNGKMPPRIGTSDLASLPVRDLLAIAKNYGVYIRRGATGFMEVIAPPGASPIARTVAARLRTRIDEIAAHFAPAQRPVRPVRPCREAA